MRAFFSKLKFVNNYRTCISPYPRNDLLKVNKLFSQSVTFGWNSILAGFWGRQLRMWTQSSENQNEKWDIFLDLCSAIRIRHFDFFLLKFQVWIQRHAKPLSTADIFISRKIIKPNNSSPFSSYDENVKKWCLHYCLNIHEEDDIWILNPHSQ